MSVSPGPALARLPEIGQLRAALAVLHYGSVTLAAASVGLSQPAVSRLVATLEADLGFLLFHRARRRLTVSERGRAYLQEAVATLGGLARLGELGRELRRNRFGLLRLAAVSALAYGLVPRAVAALMRDYPGLAVEIEELDRSQQIEGLLSRHLDMGFVALPFGAPGLRVDLLVEADAVCLLPSDHRLARRPILDPGMLAGEPFVRLRQLRLLEQMTDDAFARFGQRREGAAMVDSTPLMIAFVAAGHGLAITHGLAAIALPVGVIARPFRPSLSFGFAALTRAADEPTPTIRALTQIAREIAAASLRRGGANP